MTLLIKVSVYADVVDEKMAVDFVGVQVVNGSENLSSVGRENFGDSDAYLAQSLDTDFNADIKGKNYLNVIMRQIFPEKN